MKLQSALVSGTLAAAATTVVASLLSRRSAGAAPVTRAFVDGAAVSAIAYVTDLPRPSLACVYAALAVGLAAKEL